MSEKNCMLLHNADTKMLGNPAFIYEEKYDGERALIYVDGKGDVKIIGRSGRDITHEFPEIADNDGNWWSSVFDGEIIVPSNMGDRDKPTTAGRMNVKSPAMCRLLAQQKPAVFMCFDVLVYQGVDVSSKPLMERKALLAKMDMASPSFQVIKYCEDGKELWERVVKDGGEGIVVKRKSSVYQKRRSYDWLKIKTWQEGDFKVVGYTSEKREISALLLEKGYKVNFSVSDREYAQLLPKMRENPKRFVAKVKYFSMSEDGLRFPILRGLIETGEAI